MRVARPAGPRGNPITLATTLRRDPTGFLEKVQAEYGDVSFLRLGPEKVYVLLAPAAAREVLVTKARSFRKGRGLESAKVLLGEGLLTSEGDFHLRQRRLAQVAFHHERVAAYEEIFRTCAEAVDARWRDGERVDMAAEMTGLTLAVVGRALFATDVAGETAEVSAALTTVMEGFDFILSPFAQMLMKLPLRSSRKFLGARDELDTVIYRLIARRRAEGARGDDLLSMLVEATEDGERMTDTQLRDEAMTLFLAGHETTANALAWSWLLLSQHPEYRDADARHVVAEAMRLYPPAYVLGRRATEDVEVDGTPVPKGSLVLLSQWVTHRDPRWWPKADEFLPERWESEDPDRPRFAYYPFGGGGRVCIGESFAWLEATVLLSTLAARWAPEHDRTWPVATKPAITLRPRGGLPMTLRRV